MPDPILILKAMGAAALAAAAAFLLCAWQWRKSNRARVAADAVLGVGVGCIVGCWWLGLRPNWPPREDQDRLLVILLPAVVVVEFVAVLLQRLWLLAWLLRLLVAAAAAPILLYNTSYLSDLAGPGTREWTPARALLILGALAAALAGVWASLALLAWRQARAGGGGRSIPLAVACACAGTAVTIMLSGYASGGQVGLPLAAALAGAVAASLVLPGPFDVKGVLGVGIVGLFALLVVGRFFGELATAHALLLFFGLLLCWLPELPPLRKLGPLLRGLARMTLVAVPVAVALILAQQKFVRDSARTSTGGAPEPSIQDYMDFGK